MDQYVPIKYNETELLSIFPEALPIIKRNLRLYQKEYNELEPILKEVVQIFFRNIAKNWAPFTSTKYFTEQRQKDFIYGLVSRNFYDKPLNKIKHRIRQLEKFIRVDEWKRKPPGPGTITDGDIFKAKQYPIENVLNEEANRAGFVHCPFHNEKTPSFKIYRDDNRWHCYGCDQSGDVIDIIMKKEKMEFIQAVKKILCR